MLDVRLSRSLKNGTSSDIINEIDQIPKMIAYQTDLAFQDLLLRYEGSMQLVTTNFPVTNTCMTAEIIIHGKAIVYAAVAILKCGIRRAGDKTFSSPTMI